MQTPRLRDGSRIVSVSSIMSEPTPPRATRSPATWLGLFLALFGMVLARQLVGYIWPGQNFTGAIFKELGMWLVGIALVAVIKAGEGLPLRSVGIGTAPIAKSILWGLVIAVVAIVVAAVLVNLTGYTGGEGGKFMQSLPLWFTTLIVIRAGVVEELCYRGYAIERLHAFGLPRWLAALVPLVIFGVAHWTGGWANIVIALALGGVFVVFYLWRRDLVANMIGHFLIDFVGNILPKLGGG
jgi:membrane protease YdiL (CAAX protease family)